MRLQTTLRKLDPRLCSSRIFFKILYIKRQRKDKERDSFYHREMCANWITFHPLSRSGSSRCVIIKKNIYRPMWLVHAVGSVPIISLACFTAPPERTGAQGYLTLVPFTVHLIDSFVWNNGAKRKAFSFAFLSFSVILPRKHITKKCLTLCV